MPRNTTGQIKDLCKDCKRRDCCCGESHSDYSTGLLQNDQRWERINTDLIIPAGAYFVDVRNADLGLIRVNGEDMSPNGEWHSEHQLNYVTKQQDFVGEVVIESLGREYWVKRAFPSPGTPNACGFATGVIAEKRVEKTVPAIIAPGAYFVDIQNVGLVPIVVNGEIVSPNTGEWHSKHQVNTIGMIQDFVGQVDIQLPNGGEYWIKVAYPGGSSGLLNSF